MAAIGIKNVVGIVLAASLLSATVKLAAAAWTGSAGVLADALHTLVTAASQGLMLIGLRRQDRSTAHGGARATADLPFWSFVAALLLYPLAAGAILYAGIGALTHMHALIDPAYNAAALGVAAMLQGAATAYAFSGRGLGAGENALVGNGSDGPVRITLLIQSIAALASLTIAAAGIALAHATRSPLPDGYAAILIGLLVGAVAALMTIEVRKLIVTAPSTPRADTSILVEEETTLGRQAREAARGNDTVEIAARAAPAPTAPNKPATAHPRAPAPTAAEHLSRKERKRRKHQKP